MRTLRASLLTKDKALAKTAAEAAAQQERAKTAERGSYTFIRPLYLCCLAADMPYSNSFCWVLSCPPATHEALDTRLATRLDMRLVAACGCQNLQKQVLTTLTPANAYSRNFK